MLKYTVRITRGLLLCGASGRMEFGSSTHRVQTVRGHGLRKQRLFCICKRNRNNGLLLKHHATCMFHFPFARALTCRNRASSDNSNLLFFSQALLVCPTGSTEHQRRQSENQAGEPWVGGCRPLCLALTWRELLLVQISPPQQP